MSTEAKGNIERNVSRLEGTVSVMKIENARNASQTRNFTKDMNKVTTFEQRVEEILPQLPKLTTRPSVDKAPIVSRDPKSSLFSEGRIHNGTINRSENESSSDRSERNFVSSHPESRLKSHHHQIVLSQQTNEVVNAQFLPSSKTVGNINSSIPKPPPSHQRCSSVGSSRSMLSASSRGTVHSNASSTSRESLQSNDSLNFVVTENSRKAHTSATSSTLYRNTNVVVATNLRSGNSPPTISQNNATNRSTMSPYSRKHFDSSEKSVASNGSHISASSYITATNSMNNPSTVRSPSSQTSRRSMQSSGSSVVSRESYASNNSAISRSTAGSLGSTTSKKSLSSKSSVASANSTQTWNSRGSWETVSTRDPCARRSKIVRKSSHLQQLTEKGDGDVWVERLYKSKRSGEYKVYFVSTNTGKRSRDEPPSGASKVIYRDYDARFH